MSAYDTLVAEIAEYLDGRLKAGMDPERYARGLVEEADFSGETLHFEIRAFHSSTGAPLPFTMPTPPELRDDGWPIDTPAKPDFELTFWGGTTIDHKRHHQTFDEARREAQRILGAMENRARHPAIIYGPGLGADGKTIT